MMNKMTDEQTYLKNGPELLTLEGLEIEIHYSAPRFPGKAGVWYALITGRDDYGFMPCMTSREALLSTLPKALEDWREIKRLRETRLDPPSDPETPAQPEQGPQ